MTDEDTRRAIGTLLLRAFAARDDAPPEMRGLLDRLDTPAPAPARRKRKA